MKTIFNDYDHLWIIHNDGLLSRKGVTPSGNYKVLGAVRRNNFGALVEHFTLDDILNRDIQWRYKNGEQRVFLRVLDHGTTSEWRCPSYDIV